MHQPLQVCDFTSNCFYVCSESSSLIFSPVIEQTASQPRYQYTSVEESIEAKISSQIAFIANFDMSMHL